MRPSGISPPARPPPRRPSIARRRGGTCGWRGTTPGPGWRPRARPPPPAAAPRRPPPRRPPGRRAPRGAKVTAAPYLPPDFFGGGLALGSVAAGVDRALGRELGVVLADHLVGEVQGVGRVDQRRLVHHHLDPLLLGDLLHHLADVVAQRPDELHVLLLQLLLRLHVELLQLVAPLLELDPLLLPGLGGEDRLLLVEVGPHGLELGLLVLDRLHLLFLDLGQGRVGGLALVALVAGALEVHEGDLGVGAGGGRERQEDGNQDGGERGAHGGDLGLGAARRSCRW